MKNIGIILGGGIGSRMKQKIPKQYLSVNDKEILQYSIDAFKECDMIDDFFVVVESEESSRLVSEKYGVKTILGGKTRNWSFRKALDHIMEMGGCDNVFVNEAARPLVTPALIKDFLTIVQDCACVYCVKDVTDSLEHADGTFADRTKYNLVMSPEAYNFKVISGCFDPESETTFPGHTIPPEYKKHQYRDYPENIKVTYPEDLIKLDSMLMARKNRS